ncbi:Ca-activated chloride channel family protein [Ochrobactrum sp. 19YEA23]|uniref:vWA domain-containing protein n=1 Tax=Ochrobactrum sp. 19YEA23 TaxID=3039854 RepID=UPI00247A6F45|nr:Ca-activated chloride channel family protein [Ochrobactrum sp. 19YEA23]
MISDFHFLRPVWLILLVAPLILVWLAARSSNVRQKWKNMIAPHLLERLVIEGDSKRRFQPATLLALIMAIMILAIAGPSWNKETPPFVHDTASLVIAVDLSQTMDAIDISPSRIERAKLKIHDILASRAGARTAVIAYAGTAHLVLPLTDDADLIKSYTDALSTGIMPRPGKDTNAALTRATDLLKEDGSSGTILFMTDGVEAPAIKSLSDERDNGIVVLVIGTTDGGPIKTGDGGFLSSDNGARLVAKLDSDSLEQLRSSNNVAVTTVTDDDADVRWITAQIQGNFAQQQSDKDSRWRDSGWWFLIPAALLFALTFRRGWVVRLGSVIIAFHLIGNDPASAGTFEDMWLTQDQQGRIAIQNNDFSKAAKLFRNPMWRGVAAYRAGSYQDAINAFATIDSPDSWYNQGNAFMHLKKFTEAVSAYEKALQANPASEDIQANLATARRLLQAQQKEEQDQAEDPGLKPDSVQFDDKGKQGKDAEIAVSEQTSQMWIKNIAVSPAAMLARRFSIEAEGGAK